MPNDNLKNLKSSNRGRRSRFGNLARAFFAMLIAGLVCQIRAAEETKDASGNRPAAPAKEDFRYAGRTFADWSRQLLNDLDPRTCEEAFEPVAAFGRAGYEQEAVAAFSALLRTNRFGANNDALAQQAANALAKIGSAALPELIAGLGDSRLAIRVACAVALRTFGAAAHAAKEPLLKLLSEGDAKVQAAVLSSLFSVAADDEDLRPIFTHFAQSNDAKVKQAIANGLYLCAREGDWWAPLSVQLAEDESVGVRAAVGGILASRGPATREVVEAVKKLFNDTDQGVSLNSATVAVQGGNTPLLVALLNDGLASPGLWNRLHRVPVDGRLLQPISVLSRFPDHAAQSVPLLMRIVAGDSPLPNQKDVLAALDALGGLGAAAKDAIPLLERLTIDDAGDADVYRKHAWRALKKIRGD